MKLITNLERKVGRYAISNLHMYLAIIMVVGSFLDVIVGSSLTSWFTFEPALILRGQIWRLFTWVLAAPINFSLLSLIFVFCIVQMGKHLEFFIGTFRMNFYLIGGMLLYDVMGMLVYLIFKVPVNFSLYYILLSIFMALAICMPDATVNLYFMFPIRMKWMLLVYLAELVYEIYSYFQMGKAMGSWLIGLVFSAEIIFALMNLGIFFLITKPRMSRKAKKRRREFKTQMATPRESYRNGAIHKCAICGRTENDGEDLVFRYCSKCEGNHEYCQEHLFTHEHKRF